MLARRCESVSDQMHAAPPYAKLRMGVREDRMKALAC